MLITQSDLIKNKCFYKYAHNSGPRRSPDMILNAFYVKFCAWNDGIHPEAWNLQKQEPKTKKQMQPKMEPPEPAPAPRPSARAGGPGGAAPREQ